MPELLPEPASASTGGMPRPASLGPEAVALVDRIMAATRECFAARSHAPTVEQWVGLRRIVETIVGMAEGICPPRFYLSALPCGTGKTTIVAQCIKALVTEPRYADVGILIHMPRLDLIKSIIEDAGLKEHQFAVRTGTANEELNALGRSKFDKKGRRISDDRNAQVLFTTQQKLRQLTYYHEHLGTIFPFRGRARIVRIWDESIVPRETVTITPEQIEQAATYFEEKHSEVAQMLRTWARGLSGKAVTQVPNFILKLRWDGMSPKFWNGLRGAQRRQCFTSTAANGCASTRTTARVRSRCSSTAATCPTSSRLC